MPPEEEIEEEVEASSAATDIPDGEAPQGQESSPDSTDETEPSLLDVARDSLGESSEEDEEAPSADQTEDVVEEDAEAPSPEDTETEAEPKEDAAAPEDEGPEDYSDVPFHQHPRFRKLLEERNTFSQQAESLKASAEGYDNIQSFLSENQVSANDASEALMIAADIKRDPAKALKTLTGLVDNLRVITGEALPDDLVQRVQSQNLSVDDALALSKAQAQSRLAQYQVQQAHEAAEQQRQQAQSQHVVNAVNSWEERIRTADPDYNLKRDMVFDAVKAQLAGAEGVADPSKAVEIAQAAYERVNSTFKQLRPTPRPMQSASSTRKGQDTSTEPDSLLDAARKALSEHHSASRM